MTYNDCFKSALAQFDFQYPQVKQALELEAEQCAEHLGQTPEQYVGDGLVGRFAAHVEAQGFDLFDYVIATQASSPAIARGIRHEHFCKVADALGIDLETYLSENQLDDAALSRVVSW